MEEVIIITEEGPTGEPVEALTAHFIPGVHGIIENGPPSGFNTYMRALPMPAFQNGVVEGGMVTFSAVLN